MLKTEKEEIPNTRRVYVVPLLYEISKWFIPKEILANFQIDISRQELPI